MSIEKTITRGALQKRNNNNNSNSSKEQSLITSDIREYEIKIGK